MERARFRLRTPAVLIAATLMFASPRVVAGATLPAVGNPNDFFPQGDGPYQPPGAFPLPNGTFCNAVIYDGSNNLLHFQHGGGTVCYEVTLPAAINTWGWSSVPGILGWTELICHLQNEQVVAINPALPGFAMRGHTYNDALTTITGGPRLGSSLGGGVRFCAYQTGPTTGKIILAGNESNYAPPHVGVLLSTASGPPIATLAPSELSRAAPTEKPDNHVVLQNVNLEVPVVHSAPAMSWSAVLIAIVLISLTGAAVLGAKSRRDGDVNAPLA